MDTLFPFGLPAPTAFYLVLYVLTFALHQALMHYVLAGSVYVVWTMMFPGRGPLPRADEQPAVALRDWMPFALSAAITAGVAPLLFIQILYPRQFYTGNLLLSWRWVIVVPVLIAAFYLLYVSKSFAVARWNWPLRVAIAGATAVFFVFVGFCWTANYLLGVDESSWPEVYLTGRMPFSASDVLLRMLVWGGGAFASMATIVGWQLAGPVAGHLTTARDAHAGRTLSTIATGGLVAAAIGGALIIDRSDANERDLILGACGAPYLAAAIVGAVLQLGGWMLQWRRPALSPPLMVLITVGWIVSLIDVSALREIHRVAVLDMASLFPRHKAAYAVGGFGVFVAFSVINAAAIIGCVWIVRRRR